MGHRRRKKASKLARQGQQQQSVSEFDAQPHSMVIGRPGLGSALAHLISDVRQLLEPFTASNVKYRRSNQLRDFLTIAPLFHVNHLLVLGRTDIAISLRFIRLPRGPTLTFKLLAYSLARDVLAHLRRPSVDVTIFASPPLLVLNGFASDEKHVRLMGSMFQSLFPPVNINKTRPENIRRVVLVHYDATTERVELRHYRVRQLVADASKALKQLAEQRIPNMSRLTDISELVIDGGGGSDSEAEGERDAQVTLAADAPSRRGAVPGLRSAVRLSELGPRLTLQLLKVETGVGTGQVLYHRYVEKTPEQIQLLKAARRQRLALKAQRRAAQQSNVDRKAHSAAPPQRRRRHNDNDNVHNGDDGNDNDDDDDVEYFRQEVGDDVDPDLFAQPQLPKRAGKPRKRLKRVAAS